jgi:hypothetical protein
VDWINLAKDGYHWVSIKFLILKTGNFSPVERMRNSEEELCSIRLLCLNLTYLRLEINFRTLILNSKNQFWITHYLLKEYSKVFCKKKTLTPLSGQLEAALRLNPAAGPPLSVEKIIIELLSISCSPNAATTSPTHWSNLDNIPVRNVIERDVFQDHHGKTFLSFSFTEKKYMIIKLSSLFINYLLVCSVININYIIPLNYTAGSTVVVLT